MRKSELEKLRTLNATPAMIRALQEPGTKEQRGKVPSRGQMSTVRRISESIYLHPGRYQQKSVYTEVGYLHQLRG